VTAVSREADVQADSLVYSTSDRIAARATMRVRFKLVHPRALVRIRLAAT
jgi:hypothetical protein